VIRTKCKIARMIVPPPLLLCWRHNSVSLGSGKL
jgi:hypothetical protein